MIQELIREAENELCRIDFWEYCLRYDRKFFTDRPFLSRIAESFQLVYDEYLKGNAITVSVSMPPRAGKSYITSLFCSWWLGNLPELSVMRNTCTARLYEKFSYDVREIVKSATFREIFPDLELSKDKQAIMGWNLTTAKQVSYFGAGVGGTIIGFGANIALTDDLYRGIEDAMSETYNENVKRWKESAHDSRKEKNCPEIFIGTRWSLDDVIGEAIDKGKVDSIVLIPALNENGESFCENVKSTAEYTAIKKDIDPVIWDAEYMQQPVQAEGLLFNQAELRYFNPDEKLIEYESSVAYADIADSGEDHLSCPVGRHRKGDDKSLYITSWVFTQDDSERSIPELLTQLKNEKTGYIRCESNSMGHIYSRELRQRLESAGIDCTVLTVHNSTNKHTRILMDSAFIRKHFVFIQKDKQPEQYRKAFEQMCRYLRNGEYKKDDSPDSISGLATFVKSLFPSNYLT